MVKLRLMGTPDEIRKAMQLVKDIEGIELYRISELFENAGTKRFYRQYAEIHFIDEEECTS